MRRKGSHLIRWVCVLCGLAAARTWAQVRDVGTCTPTCPSFSIGVPEEPLRTCTGEVFSVRVTVTNRIPGCYRNADTYYQVQESNWTWSVTGSTGADPSTGMGSYASFTNFEAGNGVVEFNVRTRRHFGRLQC